MNKVKEILIRNKILLSEMFLVSVAGVISSFLSYYLNFYVQSKFPDLDDFSDFQFLISLLTLITVIPATLSTSISTNVSIFSASKDKELLSDFYFKMLAIFMVLGLAIGLILHLSSGFWESVFQVHNENFFSLAGLVVFLTILGVPSFSFLYGLLRFKAHSILLISVVFFKIVAVTFFYQNNFGFSSIFYAWILAAILVLVFGFFLISNSLTVKIKNRVSSQVIKKVLFFSAPLFFVAVGRDLLSQLDFIIVKSKFDLLSSGNYALLMNLGKILLFGSILILGAMLAQVSSSYHKGLNYFKQFKIYFILILGVLFAGMVPFVLFPKLVVDLLITISSWVGLNPSSFSSYYNVMDLLPWYSIFIGLIVLINFFTVFLISVEVVRVFVGFVISVAIQFILISFLADHLYSVIIYNIITASLLLLYLIYETRKKYQNFCNSSSL